MPINNATIKSKLEIAIKTLLSNDEWLLLNDLNEVSITHKLAEYLQPLFGGCNVDCEYNGDVDRGEEGRGGRKKVLLRKEELERLGRLRESEIDILNRDFLDRLVYPDIIIHTRGTNENNLCIIEVKKSTSAITDSWDRAKLRLYTVEDGQNNLQYQLGVFIRFYTGKDDYPHEPDYIFLVNGTETIIE